MSSTLLMALLLQAAAVILMRHRLGRRWLQRPVSLLVIVAVVCQGVSEVLLEVPSIRIWDNDRIGIAQNYIDAAVLVISVGLLVMVVCYLAARPERAVHQVRGDEAAIAAGVFDWRLISLMCVPLAVLTYQGHGYNHGASAGPATPLSSNLASTFLLLFVVLAAFGFLSRYGMRWFTLVLILQSALLAAAGERTPVIADAIILFLLLKYVGLRPSRRQMNGAWVLIVIVFLGITGYRAEKGRMIFYSNSGLISRIEAIGTGFHTLLFTAGQGSTGPGLITEVTIRLDGNAFAGGVLQDIRVGQPRLGPARAAESILLAIPHALWSSKSAHGLELNSVQTEMSTFGLQQINFLPGFFGLYIGYLGPYLLIIFLIGTGLILGWVERWLMRQFTVVRIVFLASMLEAIFSYQAGLPAMLVTFRPAIVLAIFVKIFDKLKNHQVAAPLPSLQEEAS